MAYKMIFTSDLKLAVLVSALVILIFLVGCAGNPGQDRPIEMASESNQIDFKAELQSLLNSWIAKSGVQGAVLAVDNPEHGQVIVSNGNTRGTPVSTSDRFHVFSISKTFVAATVLQLIEEGRLSFEDSLSTYIPDFPNADEVTIEQLLSHTSGYANYVDNTNFFVEVVSNMDKEWFWSDTIQYAASMPPNDEPGQSYFYSDTNYVLLVGIIERETGNSFVEEVRTRFLDPLNLEDTFVRGYEEIPGGYTVGNYDCSYVPDEARIVLEEFYGESATCEEGYISGDALPRIALDTVGLGGDGIVSNAEDLIIWARALLQGSLLEDETMEKMLAFDGVHSDYGLGIARTITPIGEAIGHPGGGIDGQAKMWLVPERDTVVIVLANEPGSVEIDNLVNNALLLVDTRESPTVQNSTQALLSSDDPKTREQAADSLLNQSPESTVELIPTLLELLQNDPSPEVRSAVARALGPLGSKLANQEIFEALVESSQIDPNPEARSWAVRALAFFGKEATPYIEQSLADESTLVVEAAKEALNFANR